MSLLVLIVLTVESSEAHSLCSIVQCLRPVGARYSTDSAVPAFRSQLEPLVDARGLEALWEGALVPREHMNRRKSVKDGQDWCYLWCCCID